MGTGEFAAFGAAALWACASLLYGRTALSAWGMNLAKNILASLILVVQLLLISAIHGTPVFHADAEAWMWLGLSGIIGIVVGDTCYFRSLQIFGPRKALIVSTTAPIFAALFGAIFLDEVLTVTIAVGILITMTGVVYVVADRRSTNEAPGLYPGSTAAGILTGVSGAVCQALGAVCAKLGMNHCDPVESSLIRLFVSAIGALLVVVALRQLKDVLFRLRDRGLLTRFIPAVLLGTWLGIWLCQVAYKHTSVSIATVLLATTPLFAVPLVRLIYGHRITVQAVIGTLTAIGGVYLIVK